MQVMYNRESEEKCVGRNVVTLGLFTMNCSFDGSGNIKFKKHTTQKQLQTFLLV